MSSKYLTDGQVDKCKYMIKNQVYYTCDKNCSKNSGDDVILLKYLQEQGYTKEEAFEIWKPIYESVYGVYNPDQTFGPTMFEGVWNKASKFAQKHIKLITIYENELDIINNMTCPKWIKEVVLLVLATVKSKNKYEYHELPISKLIKFSSITRRTADNVMQVRKIMEQYGLLRCEVEEWYDEIDGETTLIDKYIFIFPKPEGDPVFTVQNVLETQQYFKLITMYKICVTCGSKFIYNMNTKRDVCKSCWQHEQVSKALVRKNAKKGVKQ